VSFAEAAVAQPAGIARHAVATRADVQPGEVLLIQGCGPIGLSAMVIARLRGATVISTDIVDYRIQKARQLGADYALNDHQDDVRAAVAELTEGRGVDKVIECVGSDQDETVPEAVECVKPGGLVVVVGSFAKNRATLPIIDFKFSEKTITGSQGMPEGYGPVFELILSKQLDVLGLISHRLPLEQAERGLDLMDRKADQVLKVVLEPSLIA
jgi:threonine dehydrogenase-like Zn-dependent dehydrogenase